MSKSWLAKLPNYSELLRCARRTETTPWSRSSRRRVGLGGAGRLTIVIAIVMVIATVLVIVIVIVIVRMCSSSVGTGLTGT